MLALTLPLMALTALAIKIDSPGPVFYRQQRIGRFDKPFTLFKFRSMTVDAEAGGNPRWAQQQDPRVTRVGRFIRATRIDELPQLVNVLRGEMSLVGPRPERPHFVEQLARVIPFYRQRAYVKPGLTGWAQVNFPYGASVEDAREKLAYDLYYVKNRTLLLDLLILSRPSGSSCSAKARADVRASMAPVRRNNPETADFPGPVADGRCDCRAMTAKRS